MDVANRHQLKIARDTLKMSDIGATIMGGMTKAEARATILRLTGKPAKGIAHGLGYDRQHQRGA